MRGWNSAVVSPTGESAVEKIPLLSPDVVVADINLPGISGVDCVSHLKQEIPQSQFMMFTIYEENEHIFRSFESRCYGLHSKEHGTLESRRCHGGTSRMRQPDVSGNCKESTGEFQERSGGISRAHALAQGVRGAGIAQ